MVHDVGVKGSENRLGHYIICTMVNPLGPNSDRYQISPRNIITKTTKEVKKIKDAITQDEFSSFFTTFSH